MRQNLGLIAAACLLVMLTSNARAAIYMDATNELFTPSAQQLDIASVVLTNDASNLYFTINLVGNPQATNWGSHAIAFVTGPGGDTNSNGSGAAISLTEGINYWVTCLGWGNPGSFKYNASTSSWVTNHAAITFANSSSSVSLTVPYASVGLTNGAVFQFDVYTFSGTGGAVDDLANPVETINWWSVGYTNNLVETYSSFTLTNSASSWLYIDATNDLFTDTAQQLDIASVLVTNNNSTLDFTINLVGNPQATNWGSYAIAFVTGPGGDTNSNGSGAAISLTEGINFWLVSLGWGELQLYQYTNATWIKLNSGTFANSSNSITMTIPYYTLNLTNGQGFKFDVYTFSGTGGAVDDLANPVETIDWWSVGYTNNLVETFNAIGGLSAPPPPLITSVSPPTGGTNGGTVVILRGSNFLAGATIQFAGNPAATGTLIDSNAVAGVTPPNAPGLVSVVVLNPTGQSVTNQFAYVLPSPPAVPSLGLSRSGVSLSVCTTNTVAGAQYVWESTPRLAPATWTPVATNLGNGNPFTNLMTVKTGVTNQFFRCTEQPLSMTVHLLGDSTVAIWSSANYPKTGWGQVLNYFFNSNRVAIDDAAVSGASAKSFYNSFWPGDTNRIKAGDFVFIQFGINDSNTNVDYYSDPETTFKGYLTDYVDETLALGAYPVLITPQRNVGGSSPASWGAYPQAIRELAATSNVPLIDLDAFSGAWINSVGISYAAAYYYMNLPAGVYSNYSAGNSDNTHLQEMGAIQMAKLVLQGIQDLGSDTNVCRLIPSLNPTYEVNFSSGGAAGTVTLGGGFPAGITVTAKAVPASGFNFTGWTGDLNSTNAVATFIMGNAPENIHANFSSQ